jgi:hypothetical protein
VNKEEFGRFVLQKADEANKAATIDWQARKQEWLGHLEAFYGIVEGYLDEFVKEGNVSVTKASAFISEELIGTYEAPTRAIFVGKEKVTLTPVGTLLIGAKGRVDMAGPAGTAKFILTGKHSNGVRISVSVHEEGKVNQQRKSPEAEVEEEWVWKLATPPPRVRFIELTSDTFFNALTEVLNG